jgi:hypothetical protein
VDDLIFRRELEGPLDILYEGKKHNKTHLILASLRVVDDLIFRRELEGPLDILYEGKKNNKTHLILASLRVVDDLILRRELEGPLDVLYEVKNIMEPTSSLPVSGFWMISYSRGS